MLLNPVTIDLETLWMICIIDHKPKGDFYIVIWPVLVTFLTDIAEIKLPLGDYTKPLCFMQAKNG